MNYFFSIQTEEFNTRLTIPKFQNSGKKRLKNNLYKFSIYNNAWQLEVPKYNENDNFYFIDGDETNNNNIFFLATKDEIDKYDKKKFSKLINFNNFTDTMPDYRSNLRLMHCNGGFSSYQSEYPYLMTEKMGSILSPLSILLSNKNEKNLVFFKNIYYKPIQIEFEIYFIDIVSKKIISKKKILTNKTNSILIHSDLIHKNIYLFSKDYLGIPIFLSMHNGQMSLEHTHPPHLYILGKDKYKIIADLKNQLYESIN